MSHRGPENGATYRRRRPETTALHQAVRRHMSTFLERISESAGELEFPPHVRGELERYLRCGLLSEGFVRVYCPTCKDDLLVAFSCKGRGVCPSCTGRRMADTAARWVDRVLPEVSWRQWVLTVPFELRLWMAWDPTLLTEVLTVFQRALGGRLRLLAKREGARGGRHASVTVVQRFGSALNLNVHFHMLVSEGVWVPSVGRGGAPRFVPLRPRHEDVIAVLRRVERRVLVLLLSRGLIEVDEEDGVALSSTTVDPEDRLLLGVMNASMRLRVASGPRAGKPVQRVGTHAKAAPARGRRKRMHAKGGGFDLHAGLFVPRADRERLERVSRYLLRPALALERLQQVGEDAYEWALKRPWGDGTRALRFSGHELMEKLAVLVPMPCANLVRYHGVLAPAARWRRHVLPQADAEGRVCGHRPRGGRVPKRRVSWAQLLKRVFIEDVLRCRGCGGPRRLLAEVTHPDAVLAILTHLGIDPTTEGSAGVRGPPRRTLRTAS
jgi:hypothetical protein